MLATHIRPHFGPHAKVADVTFADVDALHRKITQDWRDLCGEPLRRDPVEDVLARGALGHARDQPGKGVERNTSTVGGDTCPVTSWRGWSRRWRTPGPAGRRRRRLLLLTGARRGEALGDAWADIDLTAGTWSKPPSSTKQKDTIEVPLSAPARALLSGFARSRPATGVAAEFVFPGVGATGHRVEIKKDWRRFARPPDHGLRIHDLRHSFASQLVCGGARCR